jgi:predicted Rossmann-fold nucleotide-binding protein
VPDDPFVIGLSNKSRDHLKRESFALISYLILGLHPKPCALLNINHFYDPLFTFLSGMVATGFLHPDQLSQLIFSKDPQESIELLMTKKPRLIHKWVDKKRPQERSESTH